MVQFSPQQGEALKHLAEAAHMSESARAEALSLLATAAAILLAYSDGKQPIDFVSDVLKRRKALRQRLALDAQGEMLT